MSIGWLRQNIIQKTLYILIALVPFNTLLSVWISSKTGHLFIWSAWPELLVGIIACYTLYQLVRDEKLRVFVQADWLTGLIAAFVALNLIYVIFAPDHFVATVGAVFATRFLILFACLRLLTKEFADEHKRLQKLVLYLGVMMSVIALIQVFLLPQDFLTHFGYDPVGLNTPGIPPAYHSVGSSGLMRAQATLRGPNVLGAYLLLPLSIALVAFITGYKKAKYLIIGTILSVGLFLSFSRSAWLGSVVVVVVILMSRRHVLNRLKLIGLLVIMLALVPLSLQIKQAPIFKSLVLHENSASSTNNSTPEHFKAFQRGVEYITQHPFGHGVGSAGPVSALEANTNPKIAENYFVQTGQELGWAGLLLLLAIHALLVWHMWLRRNKTIVRIILAAFLGLIATNLMLHTWADEAVALTWWGLAGAVLASTSRSPATHSKKA